MYTLKPDEKTTPVMLYTKDSVVRGEVVTKEVVHRLNIWLRSDGVPRYMHLLKAQVLVFGCGQSKALIYPQLYFPSAELIAFHTMPPTEEPLDYDPAEANRMLAQVEILVGTFIMKGKIRISTHTDLETSLEVARVSWLSLYDAAITNPHLPQMPLLNTPMVLVNPAHIAFGVAEQN